jgi:hypothetical protein
MRLTRISVFPLFLSASWINSPNRDAFQNAQRNPWKLEFDNRAYSIARFAVSPNLVIQCYYEHTFPLDSLWQLANLGAMDRTFQSLSCG